MTTTTLDDLSTRLAAEAPPLVLDVRTPAEYETAHIGGSVNVPLDVVQAHPADVASRLTDDVVVVCRSGQRAGAAHDALRRAGLTGGSVLADGVAGWQARGFEVRSGTPRWELERQVRLVAGAIVATSVLGSVAVPRLKWLAAAIGSGLVFAAVSDTCTMARVLATLPYNNPGGADTATYLARLDAAR